MKKRAIIFIAVIILYPVLALTEEERSLERIVVKARSPYLTFGSAKNIYSAEILTPLEIKNRHPDSPADVLNGTSGMDLRYRSTSGVQGDISLRGSTCEQAAVLIDGINVNDPQTGHHNLDIPLTAYDVERVEVVKEGDSSLYGAGALAGSANFVTKKPLKKAVNVDAIFGGYALFGQGVSLSLPGKDLSGRVSFEHKISKAARPNTDFEYKTASLYLNKDFSAATADTLFGYQKKDFGADSFYSNLYPQEEEHTETIFTRTGLDNDLGAGAFKNNIFFRRHKDKFILQRNNPVSVNYHTTYLYGLDSGLNLSTGLGEVSIGADFGRDEINSTNLGKHSRLYEAISAGFIPKILPELDGEARARADHYNKWGWQESYNFGLGYGVIGGKLKVSASAGRSFRLPSFTDLYYSVPGNTGNPNLKVEKADSFKTGLKFKDKGIELGIEGFFRRVRNLIDWTRASSQDSWQATNLGRVDFRGAEFKAGWMRQLEYKGLVLKEAQFGYTYMDADKKTDAAYSKYALDILKHQLLLDIYSQLFGIKLDFQLSYNQRYYGETYFVGGLYIGKRISNRGFNFEPFLKIDNFTNTKYSENSGVLLPGRWIKSGLKFTW